MPRQSAGLLVYRYGEGALEVFLVHPGGPFWRSKDLGAWSIAKGEFAPEEDPLTVAKRELLEETGLSVEGAFRPLTVIRQKGGKIVHAWAVEADLDPSNVKSNTFAVEWPRGSGKFKSFPEVDRAEWFPFATAREKILASQLPLLDELASLLT